MAETPLLHDVLALATNCTLVATSLLFRGADTVTPANAGAAMAPSAKTIFHIFIETDLPGLGSERSETNLVSCWIAAILGGTYAESQGIPPNMLTRRF